MSIIRQIIDNHSVFFVNNKYEILDPESKLYNVDVLGRERSQEEIIESICKSSSEYNYIDYKYNNELEIRYKYEDNKINLIPLDINSVHLIRLIGIKKIPKYDLKLDICVEPIYFTDILFEINYVLDKNKSISITDYCTICSKKLKIKGLGKIQCCEEQNCITNSKIKVLDNRITESYFKDPELTEFLIQVLITGTIHPKQEKIFKPLPILPEINNLVALKTKLDEEEKNGNLDIKNIKKSKTDIELYRIIGSVAYGIINNAISDNYFSMSTIKKFSTEVLDSQRLRNISENKSSVFDSEQVKFIGFNYSYEIESTFKKENFLFHGTPLYSWYPIIKNGLKVMSGTEFQANGAAFGNGIYFSDSFQFSLNYSSYGNIYTNKNNKTTKYVVGIFEINDDIEKFKKAPNIYVIDNDKIMLLRYLVIVENNHIVNYQEITDYFFKYLGGINKSNQKKSVNIKNKRLNGEMKLLDSNQNVSDVKIIDESKNWIIELKDIKKKKIKLIIYFNDYPRLPPKITIESNINKKIISDDSNNLILPELNPSKWDVTLNLSKIVDKVHVCLSNTI
jgi:ubiquitin-protein ligase